MQCGLALDPGEALAGLGLAWLLPLNLPVILPQQPPYKDEKM